MTDSQWARLWTTIAGALTVVIMLALLGLAMFLLSSCCFFNPGSTYWNCPRSCYSNWFANITSYEVKPAATTPKGIRVDAGGHAVDLALLDARIDKIEACLREEMAKLPALTEAQRQTWQCPGRGFVPADIKRWCLQIKIVDPVFDTCSSEQYIDALAPEALCLAKGLKPTPACPCRWRTAVQDDSKVITPPAMHLWEIPRIVTSCNNIWASPFARCAMY